MAGLKKTGLPVKAAGLLALSMLAVSVVAQSGAIYEEFQLAKSLCFLFFLFSCFAALLFAPLKPRFNAVFAAFAVYFAYSCFRIIFTRDNPSFNYTAALLAPAAFVLPHYIKIDFKKLLALANVLVSCAGLLGVLQFMSGTPRPYSFFGNPIFFSEFLLACLPLLAASFFISVSYRPLILANIMLSLLCVVLCSSRAVFISLFIEACLLAWYAVKRGLFAGKRSPAMPLYLIIITVFVTFSLVSPGIRNAFVTAASRAANIFSKDSAGVQNRLQMARAAFGMLKESPVFGKGAGAFKYLYQDYQSRDFRPGYKSGFLTTSYAHNDYIQLAAEYGPLGLLLFLAFVFFLLYHYERKYYAADRAEEFFAFAAACASIGLLSESFFNFPLLIMPSAVIFWFLCGVLNSLVIKNSPENAVLSLGRPAPVILLLALAALAAASAVSVKFNPVSDFYLKKALLLDAENSAENYGVFKKAISLSPRDFYAHFYLADSYSKSLRFPGAIEEYKLALSIYPYSADMLYNTGSLLVMNKQYPEAEKYLRQSIALYPDFALSRLYLAKALSFMDRDAEAAREFDEARSLDPSVFSENAGVKIMYFGEATGVNFDK